MAQSAKWANTAYQQLGHVYIYIHMYTITMIIDNVF